MMLLSRDDWDLTLNELRGQRVSLLLQLAVVEAGIVKCESMVASFPVPRKVEGLVPAGVG